MARNHMLNGLMSVLLACFAFAVGGCTAYATREPLGERIDMKRRDSKAVKDLALLTSNSWKGDLGGHPVVLRFTDVVDETFILEMEPEGKSLGQGFARVWGDRLILQSGSFDRKTQKPILLFVMVKLVEDPDEGLKVYWYLPRADAFKVERTAQGGKKVKLDVEASGKDEGGGLFLIKSDEATIAAYLAACKPDDLFEAQGEAQVFRVVKRHDTVTQPGR